MANTGFQLEGNTPQLYEQFMVPRSTGPLAEQMLEHVSVEDGDRVLDVACGTGIVTRLVAERFGNIGSIVGMDLNAGMLDVARANTPTTDIPIEWQQGDLCALPFPDSSFNVVLCNQGMQFVPAKSVALGEIRRVLVSGGRLVFTVWSEVLPYQAALADALRRHVSDASAVSLLAAYTLSDVETIQNLLDAAGFDDIKIQELVITRREPSSADSVLEFVARLPIARDVAAVSEEARIAIGQEVTDALQSYREGDEFVMSVKSHLVQAQVA